MWMSAQLLLFHRISTQISCLWQNKNKWMDWWLFLFRTIYNGGNAISIIFILAKCETVSCPISQLEVFSGGGGVLLLNKNNYARVLFSIPFTSCTVVLCGWCGFWAWDVCKRSRRIAKYGLCCIRVKFPILLVLSVLWIPEKTRIHVWHKLWTDTKHATQWKIVPLLLMHSHPHTTDDKRPPPPIRRTRNGWLHW